MKIGIICYPSQGGSGVVASELGLGLARLGHEVHFVSYATPFRLSDFNQNVYIHEVEVASYPLFKYPPYALALATKLVDVAHEYGLDIIHAHYAIPHAASAFLAKHMLADQNIKTVTTLHGTDITLMGLDSSFFRAIQFSIEESDGVTAVSSYLRKRTIDQFEIKKDIRVIYNFIDIDRYHPQTDQCTKEHFAPHGECVLMHASNFRPLKRVADVVRMFEKVHREIPSKLLLVGEGPERLFVQQLVKELKLSDDVFFLGEQNYLERLMPCADVFILPSEQESFGLVALEAHSCGVPVIGSATGGLPEVVVDGETGYLFPIGEVSQMATKTLELLQDADRFETFSKQARERAVKCFDGQEIIPQYEAFYEEILGGSRMSELAGTH